MVSGLIDSHCHLDRVDDLTEALNQARAVRLSGMVTIGTEFSNAQTQLDLTRHSQPDLRIWCSLGTHPDSVQDAPFVNAEEIAERCNHPAVIGIGETGLDFFHGDKSVRALQEKFFRTHIAAARMIGLPLIIHARDADDDMARILEDETGRNGAFPFLMHCFASGMKLAETALKLGGYISFSGIITFRKTETLQEIARSIPEDRLLVETDSPFLAPAPNRGKPNMPAYVTYTAMRLAELRDVAPDQLAARTTANFYSLFSKAA